MTCESDVVASVVPHLYESVAKDFRMPLHTNLAASNQCHVLSKGLHISLANHGFEARREFHADGVNIWHFVIAHSMIDAEPTQDDLITDLNPWQFMQDGVPGHYTYLHAPRGEVMERLQQAGAPDYFVALRGLNTIVHPHTDEIQPKL